MCGIVGYIGSAPHAYDVLLDDLHRLEYRGYDSAGIALVRDNGALVRVRAVGKVAALEEKLTKRAQVYAKLGIAHTRWATHGAPSVRNAHPHTAGAITLVHNGIIENFAQLREEVQKEGRMLRSDTDTEVIAHLIDMAYAQLHDLADAVRAVLPRLRGAYALLVIAKGDPKTLVAVRVASPLVMGVAADALFFASDAVAIVAHTHRVIYPLDGEIVVAKRTEGRVSYTITTEKGALRKHTPRVLKWDHTQAQKEGYAHFMLKEIMEQPHAVTDAMRGRLDSDNATARLGGLAPVEERLRTIKRIIIVSCGTSYHAGLIGAQLLQEYSGIVAEAVYASEFRYSNYLLDKETAVLAISQSGETADTLAAVREAKNKGVLTLGIVNAVGSSIAREVDAGVYNHAGPEISVASTKAFTSQLIVLVLIVLLLGRQRTMSVAMGKRIIRHLCAIPRLIETVCQHHKEIRAIARRYKRYDNFLYVGRLHNFPIALEGALKIKEIAYVHAEGYPFGEMKHGPIALVEPSLPTVVIAPRDSVYEKNLSGIQEIRARRGKVIAITTHDAVDIVKHAHDAIIVPKTLPVLMPLITVIPLQLLAYEVGVAHGVDVDKPRNLAKSVTVE